MEGNREMFYSAKNQLINSVTGLKVEPKDLDLQESTQLNNGLSKIQCEEIHIDEDENDNCKQKSEPRVEENSSGDSEALYIENSKCIKETSGLFDYEKEVFIERNIFSAPSVGNEMKMFGNLIDLKAEPKDVDDEKETSLTNNWLLKIESEEMDIKQESENEFEDVTYTVEQNYKSQNQKTFSKSRYLQKYLSSHSREKKFKCDFCGKTLLWNGHLKRHLLIHTGGKKFKCDICGKTFLCNAHLKTHLLTHTGEKKFKCEICGQTLSRSGNLKTHLLIHSGEKKFKCEMCQRTFLRKGDLTVHFLIHTRGNKSKCKICQKSFPLSANQNTPLLTDPEEKKCKCEIYPKLSQNINLKYNLLIHPKEKVKT